MTQLLPFHRSGEQFAFAGKLSVLVFLASLFTCCLATQTGAQPTNPDRPTKGGWTGPFAWGAQAVHMTQLRGKADSTWILWWGLGEEKPRLSLWKANQDTLAPLIVVPAPASLNVFCSGHSTLADGRVVVLGGTSPSPGLAATNIFDPIDRRWLDPRPPDMAHGRWYATSTTLETGNVIGMTGAEFAQFISIGGRDKLGSLRNELHRVLGLHWSPVKRDTAVYGSLPPAREDHTAIFDSSRTGQDPVGYEGQQRILVYAGRSSPSASDTLGDLWELTRSEWGDNFSWTQLTPATDPIYGRPAGRSRHTAVSNGAAPGGSMVVFGGQAGDSSPLGDLWALNNLSTGPGQWKKLQPSGGLPLPRYGHTAVYDETVTPPRMLVFGGRLADDSYSNEVWALSLPVFGDPSWTLLSSGVGPSGREGHSAVFDRDKARLVIFGGRGADSLYHNDVWAFSMTCSPPRWNRVHISASPYFTPLPRWRHTAIWDDHNARMLVLGGEAYGDTVTGQLWHLDTRFTFDCSGDSTLNANWSWGFPSLNQYYAPRSRLAAVMDPRGITARVPERFDPTPIQGQPGSWQTLPTLNRWLPLYPFIFLLPSGKLFYAGPHDTTRLFSLSGTPAWQNSFLSGAGLRGGSAVMFRPGKVMKCGNLSIGHRFTAWIDLSGSPDTAQWRLGPLMNAKRAEHNLTMLPTGDVLITGGVEDQLPSNPPPVKAPEIWYAKDGSLSTPLAADPMIRDYHSTAMLLLDGRVITAGGSADGTQSRTASIYWPAFLFKSDGTLATRPAIDKVVERIRYGRDFSICMASSQTLKSVCLIRPSAVTHAFDQNQRYVPLTIKGYAPEDSARVTVSAPIDSFTAPPGDYMLFLVDGKGVPCVARWIRMGSVWNSGDVTPPATVIDLDAEFISQNSVGLTWTTPGDDGGTGQAWQYELRWAPWPITSYNFSSASLVSPPPIPYCALGSQSYEVTGLSACTWYYFAIRTADESGNLSAIGFSPAIRTLCGGGGGGLVARQARDEEGGSATAGFGPPLPTALRPGAIAASALGLAAQQRLVAECERTGAEVSWTLHRMDSAVDSADAPSDPARITLQESDGAGGWRSRNQLTDLAPRVGIRSLAERGRVVLPAVYDLETLETQPPSFDLTSAISSRLGDLSDSTVAAATILGVGPGDTLRLTFAPAPPSGTRSSEDCFFIVSRPYQGGELSDHGSGPPESAPARLLVFALEQNQPNPLASTTTIPFNLPRESDVKLEIFDLIGRRIRTLANASFGPGTHRVVWDRRTGSGTVAAPGLYFYRIQAGPYRAVRRMAILP